MNLVFIIETKQDEETISPEVVVEQLKNIAESGDVK